MAATDPVTFYHTPQSRSTGILILLEEMGVDYNIEIVDMRSGKNLEEAYLKVNPMGKVPAVVHNGALVTEQVALYTFLPDLYPETKLSPALDDPMRGHFLRWIAFYGSCFEPAVVDKSLEREPGPRNIMPYGTYEGVVNILSDQLKANPYIAGDRFTAADVLWGTALQWITGFGMLEATPEIKAYLKRVGSRDAVKRAMEKDNAYNAELPSSKEA